MALAIRLRRLSSRLTKNLYCPGILFVGILSLNASSIVLIGVVDAVVVAVLIGSAVPMICFYLNLKLRREEKPSKFKISISNIGNKIKKSEL